MNLPQARNENIVIQQFDKELLIYDLIENKALCLNETSAKIFAQCDGKTTFDELKSKYKFTDDLIYLALDGLRKENLIEGNYSFVSPFAGMNRREAIRKVGLASMIALPVISALVAPTAASAASPATGCSGSGVSVTGAGSSVDACIANVRSKCCNGATGVSGSCSSGSCTCRGTCT